MDLFILDSFNSNLNMHVLWNTIHSPLIENNLILTIIQF